ncbi:MAG TPA: helix-turn-helix domain-containing protein [Solirubrobacteraceae bacterium]|nr:helix-turn-helix domain-containing protein [Solirubrobacteraceae bacterium]
MPEIGETLREARMRRRIDMTEVESATKIRGKYLRALENEEWELLPGPTFVKTFLRTYAEYLGLDARLLVEEYRQRFERPSTQELTPFRRQPRRARRRLSLVGPGVVLFAGVLLLLGIFWVLGTWGDDEEPAAPAGVAPTATPEPGGGSGGGGSNGGRERERERERRPRQVRLQLVASGPVYVCLVDARGRQVIDEETLQAGTRTDVFRSRFFRTNFGNANVRMRVNGRLYDVAASSDPVGYELRPGRPPRRLSDAARPDCSS